MTQGTMVLGLKGRQFRMKHHLVDP